MKLTIPTKQLVAVLASLKSIAKTSSTHPILSNVILNASGDELMLTAYDLEKQLSVRVKCTVKESGSTTISCAKLHDWLSSRPEPSCDIATDAKHKTTAKCGKSSAAFLGLPPEEFPELLKTEAGTPFKVDAGLFSQSMGHSLIHSSLDKSRAVIVSVFLCENAGNLAFVGTNGNRLCAIQTDTPCSAGLDAIIPRESAQTLAVFATVGELTVTATQSLLSVASDNQEFTTKLIEAKFPNWKHVIPKERGTPVTVAKDSLAAEIASALAICGEIKTVALACDGAELTVTASESAAGQYTAIGSIPAKGSKVAVAMNPVFLRDTLKCLSNEEVTLNIADEVSPLVIEDGFFTAVIMPMRIQ